MRLSELLNPQSISLRLKATTKAEALLVKKALSQALRQADVAERVPREGDEFLRERHDPPVSNDRKFVPVAQLISSRITTPPRLRGTPPPKPPNPSPNTRRRA